VPEAAAEAEMATERGLATDRLQCAAETREAVA
jgi:hypothetical protein